MPGGRGRASPARREKGSRDDAGAEGVISVLGALIAFSATVLAGQLVGLPAAVDAVALFNEGDSGCYLDEGRVNSFEERAALDGESLTFCFDNVLYLEEVLPLE